MQQPSQIKFNAHDCTLQLLIPPIEIPARIKEFGEHNGLLVKPEFHISVVVSTNAWRVHEMVGAFQQFKESLHNLETLAHVYDWAYTLLDDYSYHEEVYSLESLRASGKHDIPPHTRRSIIQRVDMPSMQKYYDSLDALFGEHFEVPIPHVTLFSWSDFAPYQSRGISIGSEKEFSDTFVQAL